MPNDKIELVKGGQNRNGVFEPRVNAADLVNPRPAPVLTPPTAPTINPNTMRTVGSVAKNVNGIIEADTAENTRLKALREEQSAFGFKGADLFADQMESSGTNTNIKDLKDINLQLADMQTKSNQRKVNIAGAGGQTLDQGLRELTQEDKEEAVRQTGLAARASVLTDNINTATALARDAVTFAFQDASLELSNRANQINDLRSVVDGQTQQLLDAELREIEAEEARIKEVKDAIQGAILAGASQADIDVMLSANTPDEEKLRIAQSAQASSVRSDRDLDRQFKQASIANIYDQMAARSLPSDASMKEVAELAEKNRQALDKAKDIERVATELKGWGQGKNLGRRLPEWMRPFSAVATRDFDAKAEQLKNLLTLDNLDLMSGVLSESDIKILSSSATALNTSGSRAAFDKELDIIMRKLGPVLGVTELDETDLDEIDALTGYGQTQTSTAPVFNPANYY